MSICINQLSIVKRVAEAIEQNAKTIQLAAKYARVLNGLNIQFYRSVEDAYRAMNSIREAKKVFQSYSSIKQKMDFLLAYSYHNKISPFYLYQYETFWPSFSQPPLGYFPSAVPSGQASRGNSWVPQFCPQRVTPKKTIPRKYKTIPNTSPSKREFRDKAWEYLVVKESRENFEKF